MGKYGAKKPEPPLKTLLTNRLSYVSCTGGKKKSESRIVKRIGMVPELNYMTRHNQGKKMRAVAG